MKLKRLPEDFQVEELTAYEYGAGSGKFAVYRLSKRSLGTPEAVDAIARRWKTPRQRIGYGGLKDKHALTRQYLTLHNGPRRNLEQTGLQLTYLGQGERPFGPQDIAGNRFSIVLRDMSSQLMERALAAIESVRQSGIPNYFDDQRFGSVGESREFIGQAWCRGDYERTLWLALADPHPDDRAEEREQKRILRDLWGEWPACKEALERSHRRSIVTYLADKPGDFRGAWSRVRVDLRGLYLSAFQSHLWNQLLAACLRQELSPAQLDDIPLEIGTLPFFRELTPEVATRLQELQLPLPSARQKLEPGPIQSLLDGVLAGLGLEQRELRVKYPRDSFFSKGERLAVVRPGRLEYEVDADELYPKRQKLTLRFDLPRGSYATILIKRLTETPVSHAVTQAPADAHSSA